MKWDLSLKLVLISCIICMLCCILWVSNKWVEISDNINFITLVIFIISFIVNIVSNIKQLLK